MEKVTSTRSPLTHTHTHPPPGGRSTDGGNSTGVPVQPQMPLSRRQPEQGPGAAMSSHTGTRVSFTQAEETQALLWGQTEKTSPVLRHGDTPPRHPPAPPGKCPAMLR